MPTKPTTPTQYLRALPEERRATVTALHRAIKAGLPKGFADVIAYGMIGYVVPHSLYAAGYHVDPKQPLPFMALASQKSGVSVYHMALEADPALKAWFTTQWKRATEQRLDVGKSCIRMKKPELVPATLFGALASKLTPAAWIRLYEAQR